MADENVNENEAPEAVDAPEAAAAPEAVEAPEVAEAPEAPEAVEETATVAATDDSSSTSDGTSDGTSDDDAVEVSPEAELDAIKALVGKPAKDARYAATGKRKRSVARVILTPGDGTFLINSNGKGVGRTLETFFDRASDRAAIMDPLVAVGAAGVYNVHVRVHGGGITGQTGALRHGISKALAEIDQSVRTQLKGKGFLKVDTRQVERKKAGLKKARKKPQFSKR